MATKLSNEHIEIIMSKSKSYNIFDTYIALAHISREVNKKYYIQTFSNNKADIVNEVKKYINVSYKTIYNNIDELISLGILEYNYDFSSWTLVGMENMIKPKTSADEDSINLKGFTKIRDFFFKSQFQNMKAREKRLVIFLAQLCDSKAAKSYSEFKMNLFNPKSRWMDILKTKCKYYAKNTVEHMLNKYSDIFKDNSKELRNKDLAPKKVSRFKFSFKCNALKETNNTDEQYELIEIYNSKELNLIKEKADFAEVTLNKKQIIHLVRAISTLKQWFLKERVVQIIINKYRAIQIHKSRDPINSLPAYVTAVVKAVFNEFSIFKNNHKSLSGNGVGETFLYDTENNYDSTVNDDIISILNII